MLTLLCSIWIISSALSVIILLWCSDEAKINITRFGQLIITCTLLGPLLLMLLTSIVIFYRLRNKLPAVINNPLYRTPSDLTELLKD